MDDFFPEEGFANPDSRPGMAMVSFSTVSVSSMAAMGSSVREAWRREEYAVSSMMWDVRSPRGNETQVSQSVGLLSKTSLCSL